MQKDKDTFHPFNKGDKIRHIKSGEEGIIAATQKDGKWQQFKVLMNDGSSYWTSNWRHDCDFEKIETSKNGTSTP